MGAICFNDSETNVFAVSVCKLENAPMRCGLTSENDMGQLNMFVDRKGAEMRKHGSLRIFMMYYTPFEQKSTCRRWILGLREIAHKSKCQFTPAPAPTPRFTQPISRGVARRNHAIAKRALKRIRNDQCLNVGYVLPSAMRCLVE